MHNEFLAVEIKKFCGVLLIKCVGQHGFGRVLEFLVVEPVHRAKIWDAAFRRNPCAAKKHDVLMCLDQPFQFWYHGAAPLSFYREMLYNKRYGTTLLGCI